MIIEIEHLLWNFYLRIASVIVFQSHTRVRVELDCSRSDNVVSNYDNLQRTLRVDPGASVVSINYSLSK